MTVDSTPTAHSPPSRISGRRPSISVKTSCALVGLGLPERLAEGAAKAQPLCRMMACTTGWLGIRMPTVSRPAQHSAATSGPRGMMMVRGPGQNAAISSWARSGTSLTRPGSMSGPAMWTMRGLSCGRPFATKIFLTASPLRASAAMPYTVSVGRATSSPCRRSSAPRAMPAASAGRSSVFIFIQIIALFYCKV